MTIAPDASTDRQWPEVDIDHHSAYFREHNYEIYQDLLARCPVAHSNTWGGFWFISDYQAVFDAVQDTDLFSSTPEKGVPTAGNPDPMIPIDIDPPQLEQYRRILLPRFSPGAAKNAEPLIRTMSTELIDTFIEAGEADIVGQLTTPLPARLILKLLGMDESRWPEWVDWTHSVVHDRSSEPAKAMAAVTSIYGGLVAEIVRRRTDGLGDDLFSDIMRGTVDGEPLPDGDVIGCALLMLLGGMDTTSGLTGNVLVRLDEDRALRQRLADSPELLVGATEEFLRHDTPTQGLARIVTRDATFHGRELHAGDRVLLMYAAANRDPAVFDHPDDIDLDRSETRHLAFGAGKHRCLGSNYARVMFRVMMDEILRRLPDYRISGEVVRFADAGDVYAVRTLPIAFTPGPRVGVAG
ncbi:cytochrome P450 [Frankia sp. Cas3]|uniref:cytochrome P450 n=1 Tax=Frankia sp. Cas3 TaxID=3073926 RepID=UPI002AD341C0|nr:cytochrome P450 [Frankia sp. Cas3]